MAVQQLVGAAERLRALGLGAHVDWLGLVEEVHDRLGRHPFEALPIPAELLVLAIYTVRAPLKKCALLHHMGRYREALPVCSEFRTAKICLYWRRCPNPDSPAL